MTAAPIPPATALVLKPLEAKAVVVPVVLGRVLAVVETVCSTKWVLVRGAEVTRGWNCLNQRNHPYP